MSQWMKLKAEIKNVTSFKKACTELGIKYEEMGSVVTSKSKGMPAVGRISVPNTTKSWYSNEALLCNKGNSEYELLGDADIKYSALADRLGAGYGKLIQSYAKHEITRNVTAAGGFVSSVKSKSDGTVVMRVAMS